MSTFYRAYVAKSFTYIHTCSYFPLKNIRHRIVFEAVHALKSEALRMNRHIKRWAKATTLSSASIIEIKNTHTYQAILTINLIVQL